MFEKDLTLDFETRSEADLKKLGAYEYAVHPTTEVICFGYALDDVEPKVWKCLEEPEPPEDLVEWLFDVTIKKVAHNALFEQLIYEYVLRRLFPDLPKLAIKFWKCTAAKARAHALPPNLEGACLALKLAVQKDMDGRRLILKYCKPTMKWSKWADSDLSKPEPEKYHSDPNDLNKIYLYCGNDVKAERTLDKALPDLIPSEQIVWEFDQFLNQRGIKVDIKTVERILKFVEVESVNLRSQVDELSMGLIQSATQRGEVLKWLKNEGVEVEDLRSKTVSDLLKRDDLTDDVRGMLTARAALTKTSTAKYHQMVGRANKKDHRVRDLLIYHGASTGRFSGVGLQPHNFPKGTIEDTNTAIDTINTSDLETLRLLYGDVMSLFSSCLRGMITASKGKELFMADFAAIEARVLAWCANNEQAIEDYHNGIDRYKRQASVIYKVAIDAVSKAQRQLGKAAELGCGYGMGKKTFFDTCLSWGIPVTKELAADAVTSYREANPSVPALWKNYEKAAILAVQTGKIYKLNKVKFYFRNKFLWCELPNGRKLAYYDPIIRGKKTPWGQTVPQLFHYGVNPLTKKWELQGTWGGILTENIVQAISRDIMVSAMLKIENKGYNVLLTVHDEVIAERQQGEGSIEEFEQLMVELPEWAKGCPIAAEAGKSFRYKK